MMEDEERIESTGSVQKSPGDEGIDVSSSPTNDNATITKAINSGGAEGQLASGAVRTLDGEVAWDEFARDAVNYQILLHKIDGLLDRLKLEA